MVDLKRVQRENLYSSLRSELGETRDRFVEVMSEVFCVYDAKPIPFYLMGVNSPNNNLYGTFCRGESRKSGPFVNLGTKLAKECYSHCEECWQGFLDDRSYVLAHELGHYFHYLVNPGQSVRCGPDKVNRGVPWFVGETIAELSAIRFFDKIGLVHRWRNLFLVRDDESLEGTSTGTVAFEYIRRNYWDIDERLRKLSRTTLEQAGNEFNSYRCFSNNVYYMPGSFRFGMCVKEENFEEKEPESMT